MMENTYLYSEVQGTPTMWWEPLALRSEVEEWLVPASGKAACADQLISFLSTLESEDQARTGLPWVATVVLADNCQRRQAILLVDRLADWDTPRRCRCRLVDHVAESG